jgi:hypothetical protein
MRIDSDGGASPLPTRDGMLRAGARHRKPQTHVDEQPAGSVPGGRNNSGLAHFAAVLRSPPTAAPKLGDTVSPQCLKYRVMLMHDFSSLQELL